MIRNIIFFFFFYLGIISISILFIPTLLFPKKGVQFGGRLMGIWTGICLKILMSTKIKVLGKENIINNSNFFIAATHQSMFETFYLQTIFNSPIFVLKNELLQMPVFGWYLKKIGSISVTRNKISKENLGLIDKIKNSIKKTSRPVIIFPQATRVLPDEKIPFKKGVGRIYSEMGIKCQPVAINSGYVWPKKGPLQPNKNITISILDPIEPGMTSNEFVQNIEKKIYSELDRL